ncbi:class I SAM-dependent methyltransferase [Burkholderiales bacterium]|nr:class I SAM-dependent methyltransferase [Burkholderiales bacterium]
MSKNLKYTMVNGIKCFSPEVASDYSDYPDSGFDLTAKNADSSFWVSSRNRLFKSLVLRHLLPAGKTRFLEIGCNTGDFIQKIVENENLEITGSEIYLKGLQYAKNNLPDVDFIQFDVTQGRVDDEFDLIAAFDVIEHIENDSAALSNINQMLSKNGTLILSVPQHMFLWSKLDEIVKHKRRYTRKELMGKLKENSFDISYTTSFVFSLFPLMLLYRMFDKGPDDLKSNKDALEKRVKFSNLLNWFFDLVMRIDEALIKLGLSLPFGGTLVVVARKR